MANHTLLVDVILWAVYLLLIIGVGAAIWSAVHGVRTHEKEVDPLASKHTQTIGYVTVALVAVLMVLTYALASTHPVVSNGKPFTDALWLRLTDMFIFTSILLICICSVMVVAAKFRR